MKILKIKNRKVNTSLLKKLFLVMLTFLFFEVNYANVSSKIITPKPLKSKTIATNAVFTELMAILNIHQCLGVAVTSTSVKNKYSFSTFARGQLTKKNAYTLTTSSLQTEISDRKNFQGTKIRETIDIFKSGNTGIGVNIKMETWGNRTIRLRNVVINKRRYGYFITGQVTDGNRTVYYTIAIYKDICLI